MRDDIPLVSIVINGSGQDSGDVEYNIHCANLEDAIQHGRGPEINAVFSKLAQRLGELMFHATRK